MNAQNLGAASATPSPVASAKPATATLICGYCFKAYVQDISRVRERAY
jgi:hypothetical protein